MGSLIKGQDVASHDNFPQRKHYALRTCGIYICISTIYVDYIDTFNIVFTLFLFDIMF